MDEGEFTGRVARWINDILAKDSSLPFSKAKIERKSSGPPPRHGLTILDRNRQVALTGKIKLPYQKDGNSPYNSTVVEEARKKAHRSGAKFFFTWNVNEFVLWETSPRKFSSLQEQNFKKWEVTAIHSEDHFELPLTFHALHQFLSEFLEDFARIVRGAAAIGIKTPDEKFIAALESSLKAPIALTVEALQGLYAKPRFKRDLDQWMCIEQGWTIPADEKGVGENLERAAKFACYCLVIKLVFHEALHKKYVQRMDKLAVPEHIGAGEQLRTHLLGCFEDAVKVTGDYETVFGEDVSSQGGLIPFYADRAVPYWRELINQIHDFDFSKLDYEVIGGIFERLISPETRRRYGQFYSQAEGVDLINSFCIRHGEEKVMDPACGGGTFLVRAYARKKEMQKGRKHGELLSDLFGVDLDPFATNLTTINLATRDLIDAENYPQVARSDFFETSPKTALMSLPKPLKAKGLGKMQHREVRIPPLDAVVGNPPYIRQENIPGDLKECYQKLIRRETDIDLSGRSDIHCYFWPHALTFLKEDGYLCFLTSSQWLDVDYGFRLQEWLLKNFEIVAIFESIDEPWFVGARVTTAVTVLQRQADETARMNRLVRFVQLRRPLKELLAHDGTTADAMRAVNRFRDEILTLAASESNDRYRARLVRQSELWQPGVKLGPVTARSKSGEKETEDLPRGGKWGMHLRAPDLWFKLMDRYGGHFVALGEMAEIRRGLTSGKDVFFFPKDHSREGLERFPDDHDFRVAFGAERIEVQRGKVKLVRCGEGWEEVRPIEAKYLEPEIHSLMEVDSYSVTPETSQHYVLLADEPKKGLKAKAPYLSRYIAWAEKQGFDQAETCVGRATKTQPWYDLTRHGRAEIILPKIQQYRLIAFLNPQKLHHNSSLLGLYDLPSHLVIPLCAALNSTIAILSRLLFARRLGNEGNIQLDVYSAKMMLVPDVFARLPKGKVSRMEGAFKKMLKRRVLGFLSERRLLEMSYRLQGREEELEALSDRCELDMPDRRELDDAVLELIGVKSEAERGQLLEELYAYLRDFFDGVRQKEEKAIVNKKSSRRQGPARPPAIAAQILADIEENNRHLLLQYERDFLAGIQALDTYEIPEGAEPKKAEDLFTANGVEFANKKKSVGFIETRSPAQDDLIMLLARSGQRGTVLVPRDQRECSQVLQPYDKFVKQREAHLRQLIEERTNDPDLQKKIYGSLMNLLANQ
jgi:hypothetical protein